MSTFRDVDRLLQMITERKDGPAGCALAITQGEEVLYETVCGYADHGKTRAMTPDAVFRQFSMTKLIAVVCGLIQYERGYFLLSDPVSEYLPEYRHMKVQQRRPDGGWDIVESKVPMLMRHAFSMGVGMLAHDGSPADLEMQRIQERMGGDKFTNKYDNLTEVKAFAEVPMLWEPGTHWQYGQGLDIMGAVVQVTSGMTLGEFMKKEIFEPLGMKDTGYRFDEDILSRLVECTKRDAEGNLHYHTSDKLDALSRPDCIYEGASTGLHSTLGDYTKFAMMLANGGRLGDAQILGRKTIDLMRRNQLTDAQLAEFRNGAYRSGYGYGLGVRTMMDPAAGGSNGSVGEFGWSGYLGTWVAVDPEEKISIVYMHQTLPNLEETVHPRIRAVANGLFR